MGAPPVPAPFPDHDDDAPDPSHLGTGEDADPKWQEETRGPAGPVPTNKGSREGIGALEPIQKLRLPGRSCYSAAYAAG